MVGEPGFQTWAPGDGGGIWGLSRTRLAGGGMRDRVGLDLTVLQGLRRPSTPLAPFYN